MESSCPFGISVFLESRRISIPPTAATVKRVSKMIYRTHRLPSIDFTKIMVYTKG